MGHHAGRLPGRADGSAGHQLGRHEHQPRFVRRVDGRALVDNATPKGSNWGHWRSSEFDALLRKMEDASNQDEFRKAIAAMHEILVDDAPWLWIVHDRNPRAMTKQVQGFVSAQSWFQDLTRVWIK